MSFSTDVKEELTSVVDDELCCRQALLYGILLFSKSFNLQNVTFSTESRKISDLFCDLLKSITGISPEITVSKAGNIKHIIKNPADRKKLIEGFGHSKKDLALRINHSNFNCDNCYRAFLRGAFLACGSVSNPGKSYHLEFVVAHNKLTDDLIKLLDEVDIEPKKSERQNNNVVYFKNSEKIEELLTEMGAYEITLKFMVTKVEKDVKNRINRQNNFELANLDRSINAGLEQIDAIKKLKRKGKYDFLSPELQELCELRLKNPDASLTQLCKLLKSPVSKSGLRHRLEKIIKLSKE